jgi:NADH:ubiquinone oxidoreductase subunit 4 (subunit M)
MTPETTNYMILGYVVFSVVMLIYLASLSMRQRSLKRDLDTLQELEEKE